MSLYYTGKKPENCPFWIKSIDYLFNPRFRRMKGSIESRVDERFVEEMWKSIAGLEPISRGKYRIRKLDELEKTNNLNDADGYN